MPSPTQIPHEPTIKGQQRFHVGLKLFVAGQVTLSNNLAQIQREREEAEKAAREELKKKQKTVANGGVKAKTPEAKPLEEEKVALPPAQPSMMSLFDAPTETPDTAATHNNNNCRLTE